MCGIAGMMRPGSGELLEASLRRMAATLDHRGPDDEGIWLDERHDVGFAHRRLAVLDLSPAGHQPMKSSSGRFVITFNGEIYNHSEIRKDLQCTGRDVRWQGHSDTETLLEAFESWGIEEALNRTVGMFAFAVWDRREQRLLLARDRFGEKPLYYGWVSGSFVFASELNAIRNCPGFQASLEPRALAIYFDRQYVPAPLSIYRNIYKLEPGSLLTIKTAPPRHPPSEPLTDGAIHGSLTVRRWWRMDELVASGRATQFASEGDALTALEKQVQQTIAMQSLADVPVGSFLSGGVDSSLVTAFMQAQSSQPVKTFTVAFEEAGYDESAHALAVARHLGTDHTELRVTGEQARAVVPLLPSIYDEPFADSSQIPTYLVSKIAKERVTVALSGDGGDEVFGGYNRYLWGPKIWERAAWIPSPLRAVFATGLDSLASPWVDRLPIGSVRPSEKLRKVAQALRNAKSVLDMYRNLTGDSTAPAGLLAQSLRGTPPPRPESSSLVAQLESEDARAMMMYLDTITYLPGDILCKVDRAAMAASLETRVPLLDHRVVELAWRMPQSLRFQRGQGKWALRRLLYERVPRELIERPKSGFSIPVGDWLRGPLREWAETMLDDRRVRAGGYLDPHVVSRLWSLHKGGARDMGNILWAILMFESWRVSCEKGTEIKWSSSLEDHPVRQH